MEQQSRTTESKDPTPSDIEIYKQKYENFRHFDRLRWQAPGIALAIAAGIVAFSAREGTPRWLLPVLLSLLGLLNCLCAFTMWRIGKQLESNREALAAAAERLGDHKIPARPKFGATTIFIIFLTLVGIGCIAVGIKLLVQRGVLS